MRFILLAIIATLFIGCGGGSTTTYVERNVSVPDVRTSTPDGGNLVEGVILPFGSGSLADPYVVNQLGRYATNSRETYFITSPIEYGCVVVIDPQGHDIWDVEIFDGGFNQVPYDFRDGKWIFSARETSSYTLQVRSYRADTFTFTASCWRRN